MKLSRHVFTLFAIPLAVVAIAGCSEKNKNAEEAKSAGELQAEAVEPTDVIIDDSPLYQLLADADAMLQSGDTNAANAMFLGAMEDEEFAQLKTPLFNTMIRYFVFTGQMDSAKEQYLNALRTMPEMAEPGFDTIYGSYLNMGDEEGALDWARVLATQDIGEDLRITADSWLLNSLYRTGKNDELAEGIVAALGKYEPVKISPFLNMLGRQAIEEGKLGVAETIVGAIGNSEVKDDAGLKALAETVGVKLDAAKGDFEKIATNMPRLIKSVPDTQLYDAIGYSISAAARAGKYDMVDLVAGSVLDSPDAAKVPGARFGAAREWAASVFQAGRDGPVAFPGRLQKLMDQGLPAEQVFSVFERNFYSVLSDAEATRELLAIGDKLDPRLTDADMQDTLRLYLLDATFLVEDYSRAIVMLEKGFKVREESWHKMSLAKVRAHKALQDKDYDAAVKHFREFMETLGKDDVVDPVTSITFSYDTLMGNNEKRIGDILVEAGRPDDAAAAYAAAAEWYGKALEANKAGSETEKYITQQIESLPSKGAAK